MSLCGIFDPIVRRYFERRTANSGGSDVHAPIEGVAWYNDRQYETFEVGSIKAYQLTDNLIPGVEKNSKATGLLLTKLDDYTMTLELMVVDAGEDAPGCYVFVDTDGDVFALYSISGEIYPVGFWLVDTGGTIANDMTSVYFLWETT